MATNSKKNPKKESIDRLPMWDWETLVASWRYFQYGMTISSASFPREIVNRFWEEGNRYSDEVRNTIANQFAMTDHCRNGEKDWTDISHLMDCDKKAWTTFYRFCEAWVKGFTPITVKNPDTKKVEGIMAFHVDYTDRWLGRDQYIKWGDRGFINPKCILHIPERVK